MQQTSLFNTSSSVSGYRLDYMEIYNWGTFDKKVFRISPQGNNSLLTGANASGKSTFIDALLTLLVPMKRKRFYNQSSGVEKKGDRTEESYFYGYYGNQQIEGASGSTTLKLRDKNSYSVLLASFDNIDKARVTLFQIRYCSGDELKTLYGISRKPLSIAEDFGDFKSDGAWRKRLVNKLNSNSTKKEIEFLNGPSDYETKMLDLFGMRDKALTLFNQIVGVKVLDDLDKFIHDNMLEEKQAEEEYIKLKENFQNLIEAKTSIKKAKEQIRQLEKINCLADELSEIGRRIESLEQEKEHAAYWFVKKTIELCDMEMLKCKSQLEETEENITAINSKGESLREEERKLSLDIERDEVGNQIKTLEREIRNLEGSRKTREDKHSKYAQTAREVGLKENPTAEDFAESRAKANEEKDRLQTVIDKELAEEKRFAQNKADELVEEINDRINTIKYLQSHKNNISGRVAEIRDEILNHTDATSDEIPFIGELIQVDDSEREWELAIERILHNFALRIIVPAKYYRQVNEYVNTHNLRGRIVYQKYDDFTSVRFMEGRELKDNCLLNKIKFKPKNQYAEWLEDTIYHEYNYACVSDLEEFNGYSEKAVTKEGLIKSVRGKHVKDDREKVMKRENYVLGWNNKEKIAMLQSEVRRFQDEQKQTASQIREIDKKKKEAEARKEAYNKLFYSYEKFDDIDWQSYALKIQSLTEEKKKLEATNDRVKALQEKLNEVKNELVRIEKQKEEYITQRTNTRNRADSIRQKRDQNSSAIAQMGDIDTSSLEKAHTELLGVSYESLDVMRTAFQSTNNRQTQEQRDLKADRSGKVRTLIFAFKNPSEEITKQFRDWRSDVNSLPDAEHLDLISEYQKYYQKLKDEELVNYEEKFNKYLQDTVIINVQSFNQFFQNWSSAITKTICQLNDSLKGIDFNNNPTTYIQLVATKRNDVEVKEFQSILNNAIPNVREIESTIDGRRTHFENKIVPLIKKLEDEKWRRHVMDVRSWFTYRAEEFYKETNQKFKTYESMGQLSGGEKAQLTYTILGSAIAYQFGIIKSGLDSSFRFIAIDEAFKAQDEDKARYLITLCRQLHLQLLVVTPSDNIHIVENDISFVHYVERQGNNSVLYNMQIEQFKEERDKALQQ